LAPPLLLTLPPFPSPQLPFFDDPVMATAMRELNTAHMSAWNKALDAYVLQQALLNPRKFKNRDPLSQKNRRAVAKTAGFAPPLPRATWKKLIDAHLSGSPAAAEPAVVEPPLLNTARSAPACVVGLHGLPAPSVVGWRVRVYYDEGEQSLASYDGTAEGVDPARGLKVHLDRYKAREHLTDEDEWGWLDSPGGAAAAWPGPWPIERIFGPALRGYLSKLGALADKLDELPATSDAPAAGKPGKRAAPNGGADERAGPKKVARTSEAKAARKAGAASDSKGRSSGGDGAASSAAERLKKAGAKSPAPAAPVEVLPGDDTPPDGGGGKRRKK
jgi:hypothetical protein